MNEHNHLDNLVSDNTILHLGLWYKKNKNLNEKRKSLKKIVISPKYKFLMRKTRMAAIAKKGKKRNLDVLAEVSEQIK